jgi:hypothetical protein
LFWDDLEDSHTKAEYESIDVMVLKVEKRDDLAAKHLRIFERRDRVNVQRLWVKLPVDFT